MKHYVEKELEKVGAENEQKASKLKKLLHVYELGVDPYPVKFERTHDAQVVQDTYVYLENEEESTQIVRVAGRVMAMRNSGMFIDLHDATGKVQAFCHPKSLNESGITLLKYIDVGDIIGIKGTVRRTKRGELTVNAQELTLLSKSLLPLPEKYHGLADIEMRYRQRYVDLIINEQSRDVLRKRSHLISKMRHYLVSKGFLEVETPMLHPIPGGATAKPFVTHHNSLDRELYLRIAPELYLKRLMIGGLSDKIFEVNRCFRNEGISPRHNPEFTMLELYQAYADYHDMMDLVEDLVTYLAKELCGSTVVQYEEQPICYEKPWQRLSMLELIKSETGHDFGEYDQTQALKVAKAMGCEVAADDLWGKIVESVFGDKVEHKLIQPIHVIDLPKDISPLAKVHRHDERLTERFETYINGREIANAFSELIDPLDQRKRFEAQAHAKVAGDEEAHEMDLDFLHALEYGMPPTGGLGVGIDRLTMLLTNSSSIRDVIAFPTLRKK